MATKPAGTTATPNQLIESSKFNSVIDDIYALLNAALPITAGGTSAVSKQGAVSALFDGTTIVDDDNFTLAANGDQTKLLSFDLSGLTTATTRTLTAPDASGTVSLIGSAETFSGVKTFSALPVMSGGGVTFPATQVPSADANTLDDYEEGTWVAAITFATPGNLSVSYAVRNARYVKVGRLVTVSFNITTSVFSHTTASGAVRVTGLPFTSTGTTSSYGALSIEGYTKANYTMVAAEIPVAATYVGLIASGSGQTPTGLSANDMPSGGTVSLYSTITYEASA